MNFDHCLVGLALLLSLYIVSGDSGYEIWASDQSNSAPGQVDLGVKGGLVWIYNSTAIRKQLRRQGGHACSPTSVNGPCNTLDMFPQTLAQTYANGSSTGKKLGDLAGFGRLHGVIMDPFKRYVNANFFAPNGGFVGIIDTKTKEAIALFQISKLSFAPDNATGRSVHMSLWGKDGSTIVIANLNGKAVERINVERDSSNTITGLFFDRSATLGLGKSMSISEEATYFVGNNAFGRPLLGGIVGNYTNADLTDLTPNGYCKESGCTSAMALPLTLGGRPNNSPICPIVSNGNILYTTLAGGGLLVANFTTTPMSIIGEFESNVVQGAGCGGVMANSKTFLNAGVAAGVAGLNHSVFTVYAFEDAAFKSNGTLLPANTPLPDIVYQDPGNTLTLGNLVGNKTIDLSGQFPNNTTRRDSHAVAVTKGGRYVHVMDRIQNTIEVFDSDSYQRTTYDTTTFSGRLRSESSSIWDGPCAASSVSDDPLLPKNDPAPDLSETTPDGEYVMVAFRGPLPVSVAHGGQGSCPGIGVVRLGGGGKRGRLISVIRTTNTISDNVTIGSLTVPGGHPYKGTERSDVHAVIVVPTD